MIKGGIQVSFNTFNDINEMHLDVLKEIGNIGSGNAASSLSKMLGKTVDIAIPEIGIAGYDEAYEKLGGVEAIMVGILLTLSGDINGMMMFLLPNQVACDLLNLLMGTSLKHYDEIDEMGFSAVGEMANIMSAAFVGAISDMTRLAIDISPPSSTIDMLGSIMSVPTIYFGQVGDMTMYIKNELEIAGKKTPANIIMLPDMPSLEKLMLSLGIEV